eukprot:m.33965 g.33965  ORF g.33965 m.33965 type:complete len:379 (+) comp16908_c0_seq1:245-1381(+)
MESQRKEIAAQIAGADRLLIVAAAGLSISNDKPNNPYHSPKDFAHHYPTLLQYGYRTSFQAMSLQMDPDVPQGVKAAHGARHFLNMRWNFPPTPAYTWLHKLSCTFDSSDVFAWTSNVDGCFVRAGFDPARVYTTQGQMDKHQCARTGCGTVFESEQQLRNIDVNAPTGVLTDLSLVLKCPKCGGSQILPNLRGGDWFIHQPYLKVQETMLDWLDECVDKQLKVAVIEVGVGGNTPIVTRIPASAFASAVGAAGGNVTYFRLNPEPPHDHDADQDPVGANVKFYRWEAKWDAMEGLVEEATSLREDEKSKNKQQKQKQSSTHTTPPSLVPTKPPSPSSTSTITTHPGVHSQHNQSQVRDWQQGYKTILHSLRTPRVRK